MRPAHNYGDYEFPEPYESDMDKKLRKIKSWEDKKKAATDCLNIFSSMERKIQDNFRKYNEGKLEDKDFYYNVIKESIQLGSFQEEYKLELGWDIYESRKCKNLTVKIEKIILDGMVNGKSQLPSK